MPSTIDTFPHVGENVTGIGTIAWSNTGNILFGDELFATVVTGAGQTSNYLGGRDYRFTLNPGSTINGVKVIARIKCSGSSGSMNFALTDDTGTIFSTVPHSATIAGGNTEQNYTVGSISDLWGAVITPTIVNNANFGVRIWEATGSHTINVDWITIAVTYTPGVTVMVADPYTYPYNSVPDTNLEYNRVVPAASGNYPYNSLATTNFVYVLRIMSALPNTYPYTGTVDTILVRIIPATPSNYPYNSIPDTNLVYELRIMPALPNNYPYNSLSTTTLARVYSVAANAYTFSYNTYQAGLARSLQSMAADPKTFPFFGYDVAFNNPEHLLTAVSYTYPFFGYDATLTKIVPASTEIVLTGFAIGNYKYTGKVGGVSKLPIRVEYDPYATGHTPTITFQAPGAEDFTLTKTTINRVVGSTVVPLPDLQDRKTEQVNGSDTFIEYQLNVPDAIVSNWRSADTNIATVNGSGAVSWVSNGLVNVIADTTSCSKLVFCNVSKLSGVSGPRFVDWVPGTLAYKIAHDYDTMITGTSVAAGNGEGLAGWTPLRRNMNNWATRAGVDLSAIGILNQIYASHCELTMITPRHCITADHAKIPANTWGQWLANDGTDRVCQRTITSFINPVHPPPASPNFMDLRVYQLESDVDDFIGHVKFLPLTSVWAPRLPSIGVTGINTPPLPGPFYLPLLIMDQKKRTVCRNWYQDYAALTNPTLFLTSDNDPTTYPRLEYLWNGGHGGISGDSGSPQCLIIDGQLVCHSLVSSTTFVNLASTLQAAINALGNPDNYQIDVIDITAYPTF
jgi:hypothetical protein